MITKETGYFFIHQSCRYFFLSFSQARVSIFSDIHQKRNNLLIFICNYFNFICILVGFQWY